MDTELESELQSTRHIIATSSTSDPKLEQHLGTGISIIVMMASGSKSDKIKMIKHIRVDDSPSCCCWEERSGKT